MQILKNFQGVVEHGNLPAIDLKEGRCVRLYQGEFSKETVMNEDPVAQVIIFEKLGSGNTTHCLFRRCNCWRVFNIRPSLKKSARRYDSVQVGGGIRSL